MLVPSDAVLEECKIRAEFGLKLKPGILSRATILVSTGAGLG